MVIVDDEAPARLALAAALATLPDVTIVAECATHAILAANLGPYRCGEWELCVPLLESLRPDMLCLADRGFSNTPFALTAAASSSLSLSYTASGNCSVSGNQVTLTSVGSCTIFASQAGDGNHNAAATVSQ